MGTTMCVVALVPGNTERGIDGDRIVVANVGDSRVYQFHDGDIMQLTDHSLVEDLVREGRLSPEEARTHPRRNIVIRVLGNEPDVDVAALEVQANAKQLSATTVTTETTPTTNVHHGSTSAGQHRMRPVRRTNPSWA